MATIADLFPGHMVCHLWLWPNRSNSWVTLRTNPGLHGKQVSLSVHLTALNLIFSWSVQHDPSFFVIRIVNIAPNKWPKDACLRSTSSLISQKRQMGLLWCRLWMSGVKLITGGETCWQSNAFYWRVRNWKATKMYYWWKAAPGKYRKLRTKIGKPCQSYHSYKQKKKRKLNDKSLWSVTREMD